MSYTKSDTLTSKGTYWKYRERKNASTVKTTTDRSLTQTSSATLGENPNWRKQVRLQQNATTSLSGVVYQRRVVLSEANVWCEKTNKKSSDPTGTYYDVYHFGLPSSYHMSVLDSPSSASTTAADNKAKMYFLRKLMESQRTFQGGVFLGELRETLRQLRNPAKALRNSIDSYRREAKKRLRREKNYRRANRAIRNTWLEYQYGWAPLMSDVKSGAEALARYGQKLRYPGIFLVGRGDIDSNLDFVRTQNTASSNGCSFKYIKDTWSAASVKYYGMTTSIPVNPITSAASIAGVMPRDFLPTVWEIIPYSFLVDYFTNIGDMIQGYAWQRAGLRWSTKTTIQYRRMSVSSRSYLPATNYAIRASVPSETFHESKMVTRNVYNGTFIPSITFEIPGFGTKWMNLAALARFSISPREYARRYGRG
jgi:hypothetical protein